MQRPRSSQRGEVWTRYWQHGAAHSCPGSFSDSYQGAMGAWWRAVFEPLQAPLRVLDLATGSGAVLRLAVQHIAPGASSFHGVDLGLTESEWFRSQALARPRRVHFHGGVAAETLPFGDASFDLVTSQFGLEYTEQDRSVAELRRVLAPAGAVRLVVHHAESLSTQMAHAELELMDWLLKPAGLIDTARRLAEPFSRAGTPAGRAALQGDPEANRLRREFSLLQDQSRRLASSSRCPDVLHEAAEAISRSLALAQAQGVGAAHTHLDRYVQELIDGQFRLQELVQHALTAQSLRSLVVRLEAQGLNVDSGELRDAEQLMGWWVRADHPG